VIFEVEMIRSDVIQKLRSWTLPVFTKGSRGRPVVLGSAVLCSLSNRRFVLTARHVVDGHPLPLFLPGSQTLFGLNSKMLLPAPQTAIGFACPDVAVLLLARDQALSIHSDHTFARLGEDIETPSWADGDCILLGYPGTRTGANQPTHTVTPVPLAVQTTVLPTSRRASAEFAVRFQRVHKHSDRRFVPRPEGMSGGGIWQQGPSDSRVRLFGIATRWDRMGSQIIGITLSAVVAGLHELLETDGAGSDIGSDRGKADVPRLKGGAT